MGETYEAAGVSLAAADEAVERLKTHVRSTYRPEVLGDIGGFGGLFALPPGLREPVLVSSTDGVGTKLKVAEAAGRFDSIGIDLVAMCVDDIAVQGADPLFFLDYVGVGRLDPVVTEEVVAGISAGCRTAGCALVGGEIAEHGDGHSMDLAGFVVGVVERSAIITGEAIRPGDVLVGLASPGLRSNGYSLARRVLLPRPELLDEPAWDGADRTLADELLLPSVIYSPTAAALRRAVPVHGFAHVTGGGIPGNLVRVLPPDVDAVVRMRSWPVPRIFDEIARVGEVAADEMARVFNLGIGMIAAVAPADAGTAIAVLEAHDVAAFAIGDIVSGTGQVRLA
ncbi:MAG TPA: phosphoribosylformylglycinamidine cyclo-ligase [Acidimicrobiales bacterium]